MKSPRKLRSNDIMADNFQMTDKNAIEALLLSSSGAINVEIIKDRLGYVPDVSKIINEINNDFSDRSLTVIETIKGHWSVRTRPEFSDLCRHFIPRPPKMSTAGYETLITIAYFQPVTRSEIERVRGVTSSSGTIEILIYSGLVNLGPRRKTPGNPMTFVTTDQFLERFNFKSISEMPEYENMKKQGLLNAEKGMSPDFLSQT